MEQNQLQQSSATTIKNYPLLFQQQLNQYYKDILNCEIVHPAYWNWKVPETFFLRKRKWIDIYEDWGWDEVIDYIEFDWEEYAIVKQDSNIQIKKWVWNPDISNVETLQTYNRTITPDFHIKFDWTVSNQRVETEYISADWLTLYVFVSADYTKQEETTREMFIIEYWLSAPNNIKYPYHKGTYMVNALSWLLDNWNVKWVFSADWVNLYFFVGSLLKFVQVPIASAWDLSTMANEYIESNLTAPVWFENVSDIEINSNSTTLYCICSTVWTSGIYELSFKYNDIHSDNEDDYTQFLISDEEVSWDWISFWQNWEKLYLIRENTIYQYNWSNYDLSTYVQTHTKVITSAPWLTAWAFDVSENWLYFIICFNQASLSELQFPTTTILTTQVFNSNVNHSFKRQFQGVKWAIKYWDWTTTTCTWSTSQSQFIITPSNTPSWSTNELAGCFIFISGWTWVWQVLRIKSNTATQCVVDNWFVQPSSSKYIIMDTYWEVLTFVWGDGLYAIHNDNKILRYNALANSTATVDACWNNGRIFSVGTNGTLYVSATATEDWSKPIGWWMFAGLLNSTSIIWSVTWALRVVPFNDIVVVFSKNDISVIKSETVTFSDWNNNLSYKTFISDLSVSYLGLHSFNAVTQYNTWVYFLSSKNTFLSLNIEESYYNKYKVTTEDLWVDIQQWLDDIREDDQVALWIDEETIYITHSKRDINDEFEKSVIFQYDTFYSFWHRRETWINITNIHVSNDVTYMGYMTYRYWLLDSEKDLLYPYTQHLRWFNWDTNIFSLKTILYHKIYVWYKTDLSTEVHYTARLSDWMYEYTIPLSQATFLKKTSNYKSDWILWTSLLWITPLGWKAEDIFAQKYISDVDVLEIPLWLTYSLFEIMIEWDFEIWGNLLWCLVHEEHLTPYEDVIPYLYDN